MRLIIILALVFGVIFAIIVKDKALGMFLTCVFTAVGVNIANRFGYH